MCRLLGSSPSARAAWASKGCAARVKASASPALSQRVLRPAHSAAQAAALVDDYEQAQLFSLKAGLLAAALLAMLSMAFTKDLPSRPPREQEARD